MKLLVRTRKSIGTSKEVSSKAKYRLVMNISINYTVYCIRKKNNLLITFIDRIQTIVPNETFNLEFGKFLVQSVDQLIYANMKLNSN